MKEIKCRVCEKVVPVKELIRMHGEYFPDKRCCSPACYTKFATDCKIEDRKTILLRACYDLLKKCDEGPYVKDALEETVFYDGVDCDGACLMEDIEIELDIEE